MDDDIINKAYKRISEFIINISMRGIGFNSNNIKKEQAEKFRCNLWGLIFTKLRKKPDINLPFIMGINVIKDGTIELLYNPYMIMGLSDSDLLYVFEHEGLHILNKHISRLLRILENELDEEKIEEKKALFGISADCAINSQANLPKSIWCYDKEYTLCHPENFGFNEKMNTEFYYLQFLKQKQLDKNEQQKQSNKKNEQQKQPDKNEQQKQSNKKNEQQKQQSDKKK